VDKPRYNNSRSVISLAASNKFSYLQESLFMGFFDSIRRSVAFSRVEEEQKYKFVLEEFESGVIREGLWGKAVADSEGDEQRTKSLYFKYRVRSLDDDGIVLSTIEKEISENNIPTKSMKPKKLDYKSKDGNDYRMCRTYRDPAYSNRLCKECGVAIDEGVVFCFACKTMND